MLPTMASLTTACRLSARLARSKLPHEAAAVRGPYCPPFPCPRPQHCHTTHVTVPRTDNARIHHAGFRTSTASLAAQNFTMPALSPTMTEGNIAAWRVKEGEKFAAGDVLLEIETDKATMDVEAQEDGIMFKIMTQDGAKAVPVGSRIAVIAEEGDDISALEVPKDESPKPEAASADAQASEKDGSVPKEERTAASGAPAPGEGAKAGRAQKQTYPLYPSIVQLLHENGLDASKADEIPATGPKGRLLKGDVLVYLGKARSDSAASVQARYDKLAHLDLSNIKVAEKKNKKPAPETDDKAAGAGKPAAEEALQVNLPISLASVIEVQNKVRDTLGVFLPLSTFIARAMDVANDELPLARDHKPTADELFNQVLGLDKVGPRGSQGHYVPQISALPPPASLSLGRTFGGAAAKADIYDILAGGAAPAKKAAAAAPAGRSGLSTGVNVFSLKVPKAEEKRAKVFLERVKGVLENEPGRLVL